MNIHSKYDIWESEIQEIETAMQAASPPPGTIVFTGSSTMKLWLTLARDMPGHAVVNHGFGGSQIEDAVHFAPRIITPLQPPQVVFYSGENDIASGKTAERVFGDARELAAVIHAACPATLISFISIKPSPGRQDFWPQIRLANQLLKDWIAETEGLDFIDVHPAMLNSQGRARLELWVEDGVHLTPAGYELWKQIVGPRLVNG